MTSDDAQIEAICHRLRRAITFWAQAPTEAEVMFLHTVVSVLHSDRQATDAFAALSKWSRENADAAEAEFLAMVSKLCDDLGRYRLGGLP